MPQAIVDPGELKRFALNLKRFAAEMQQQSAQLQAQFNGLGGSWRDQEQQKFADEFVQTMVVMNRFIESANQQVPFLLRKAQRAEEYLQQR